MTERHYEVALTAEEVDAILFHCGTEALLVGGQALAVWASYFQVEPVGALAEKVTLDADFIGWTPSSASAKLHSTHAYPGCVSSTV